MCSILQFLQGTRLETVDLSHNEFQVSFKFVFFDRSSL